MHSDDNSGSGSGSVSCGGGGSNGGGGGSCAATQLSTSCSNSEETDQQTSQQSYSNQLTTDSCTSKNSKSRRMEYSMRGMKLCNSSNNPSQDSAFGSMTDGELSIASSSLRMSSFQSISSPIEEGVEDPITGLPGSATETVHGIATAAIPSIGALASPSKEQHQQQSLEYKIAQSASETSLSKKRSPRSAASSSTASSAANQSSATSIPMPLDPPKILVNDKNSFYTTSPSRAFGTIEVFSQKYRVCSFEDMSSGRKTFLKSMNKQAFRSLEEERRIDSAFTPIDKQMPAPQRSLDSSRVLVNNPEKFKKLTHVAFSRKISTTKERHSMWKNSILARKNNLIKSSESLHDHKSVNSLAHCIRSSYSVGGSGASCAGSNGRSLTRDLHNFSRPLHKRVNSTNELYTSAHFDTDKTSMLTDELRMNPRKSSSERYLLSLTKLKQTAINDYEECDEDDANAIDRSEIKDFIDDSSSNGTDTSSSSTSSPSHREICQFIGQCIEPNDTRTTEEKVPLLDGMEMSPISPVETDAML